MKNASETLNIFLIFINVLNFSFTK